MACKDKISVVVKNVIETIIVQRDGWLQYFELIPHENGFVIQLKDYFGGEGEEPTEFIGWYMGADGWVENIADAYVIGEKGSTPEIGLNGNWFIDGVDTGLPSRGNSGDNKIPNWIPEPVLQGEQRIHNDIWWEAVVNTTALQEPGVVGEDIWKKAIKASEVLQTTGDSTTEAMSQKSVTDYLSMKAEYFSAFTNIYENVEKVLSFDSFYPPLNKMPVSIRVFSKGIQRDVKARYIKNEATYDIYILSDNDIINADVTVLSGEEFNRYPNVLNDGNTAAWYDSTDILTIEKDINDYVNKWKDKSINGRDISAPTESAKPLYVNDAISFDGVDDVLKSVDFTYLQPSAFFIVANQISQTNNDVILAGKSGNYVQFRQQVGATRTLGLYNGGGGAILNESSPKTEIGRYFIAYGLFNGETSELRINEYSKNTGNGGTNTMGGISIGGDTSFANVEIKEVIFRSVADSDPDWQTVYEYLKYKYSIKGDIGVIGDSTIGTYLTYSKVSSFMNPILRFIDTSLSGDTIIGQKTKFETVGGAWCDVVFVQIGLNDMSNVNIISDYQSLVNSIRVKIGDNKKIVLSTMIPSKSWSNSPNWSLLNEAIRGEGVSPILGANGFVDVANSILNDGNNGLNPIYSENNNDSGHENDLGRQVIASIWDSKLIEIGFL